MTTARTNHRRRALEGMLQAVASASPLGAVILSTLGHANVLASAEKQRHAVVAWLGVDPLSAPHEAMLRQRLHEHLHVMGWTFTLLLRESQGHAERLAPLALDLQQQGAQVIVAAGSQAALAARSATPTLPVVFYFVADPQTQGLVANLASPEGQLTGFGGLAQGLQPKLLQLLKQAVPALQRVGVLHNPDFPAHQGFFQELEPAALELKLQLHKAVASSGGAVEAGVAQLAQQRVQGTLVLPQPRLFYQGAAIAAAMAKHRMPAISPHDDHARAGLLMSYGWRLEDDFLRVPEYVVRILKGTPVRLLPVQRPTKFYLVINGGTAKRLGLALPRSLLVQAQEILP